eukprot:9045370-Prorocentrum_lima.AAC.1
MPRLGRGKLGGLERTGRIIIDITYIELGLRKERCHFFVVVDAAEFPSDCVLRPPRPGGCSA